jgi:hypothetical protein
MHQSTRAKMIQKQHGTQAAAKYLKTHKWPLYMAMFVLTGKWPRED